MRPEDLGFGDEPEKFRTENKLGKTGLDRVIAKHKEPHIVKTVNGEFEAEITDNQPLAVAIELAPMAKNKPKYSKKWK